MSIGELVKSSDLIIIGEIVSLRPGIKDKFEIGTIKVKKVIKGSKKIKEVSIEIPSHRTGIRVSTDIFYKKGQSGLWFLRIKQEASQDLSSIVYLADHPQRFQSLENLKSLLEYLRNHPRNS
jgi:hypothetical protein